MRRSANVGGGVGWLLRKSSVKDWEPVDNLSGEMVGSVPVIPPSLSDVLDAEELSGEEERECYVERCWIKLDTRPFPTYACALYWPPGGPNVFPVGFVAELHDFSRVGQILVAGDVNANLLKPDLPRTALLLRVLRGVGVRPFNTREPTHWAGGSSQPSLLDWLAASFDSLKGGEPRGPPRGIRGIITHETGELLEAGHHLVAGNLSVGGWRKTRGGRGGGTRRHKEGVVERLRLDRKRLLREDVLTQLGERLLPALKSAKGLKEIISELHGFSAGHLVEDKADLDNALLPEWWNAAIQEAVRERREVAKLRRHGAADPAELAEEWREARRKVERLQRMEERNHWASLWEQVEGRGIQGGDYSVQRDMWSLLRKVATAKDSSATPAGGMGREEVRPPKEEVQAFWSEVWGANDREEDWEELRKGWADRGDAEPSFAVEMCRPFSLEELLRVLKKVKSGKAMDPVGICPELVRAIPPGDLADALLPGFNALWVDGAEIPLDLLTGRVSLLYKKGDPATAGNYRPITILSLFYKLFEHLVKARIEEHVDLQLNVAQAGFRRGKSSSQQALILRLVQEEAERRGKRVYVALLDLRKAFDMVPHSRLAVRLQEMGLPRMVVEVILRLLRGHVNHLPEGAEVEIGRGVPQGSVLGPVLFTIFIDPLAKKIEDRISTLETAPERRGRMAQTDICLGLTGLMFADDTALLTSSQALMEHCLAAVDRWAEENRMLFAPEKTELLVFGPPLRSPLKVSSQGLALKESKHAV